MPGVILIIASLDTKWPEVKYLKELIEQRGHKKMLLDMSMRGEPPVAATGLWKISSSGRVSYTGVVRLQQPLGRVCFQHPFPVLLFPHSSLPKYLCKLTINAEIIS
jgi:hypothetical protein